MAHYAIIDYAGETLKDGFETCERAYSYLSLSFSPAFIHEMQFKIVREEVKDEQSES